MRILGPRAHGIIDWITVAIFVLAPTLASFDGAPAVLSYVLAIVHLGMSLLTIGLPISVARIVPLPVHGMVEAAVGVTLGVLGWLAFTGAAQTFYLVMGVVILAVFVISRYVGAEA